MPEKFSHEIRMKYQAALLHLTGGELDSIEGLISQHSSWDVQALRKPPTEKATGIAFRALTYLYCVVARSRYLLLAIVATINEENPHAGYVLTRAHMETVAASAYLLKTLQAFEASRDWERLTKRFDSLLLGAHTVGAEEYQPVNVMDLIDALDSQFRKMEPSGKKIFRGWYNMLSDSAHPNYTALVGMHIKPVPEKCVSEFRAEVGLSDGDVANIVGASYSSAEMLLTIADRVMLWLREHESHETRFVLGEICEW
jgi:hypothetical protein